MASRGRVPRTRGTRNTGPKRRGRQERKRELLMRMVLFGISVLLVITGTLIFQRITKNKAKDVTNVQEESTAKEELIGKPNIDVNLLTINDYSRPAKELKKVNDIVIHYTANPNTSAMDNRNYFEGLKESHKTKASSHFIVGLEGEIVQCIPTKEIAYASNNRNNDSISIENCHVDESGKFNEKTYKSLVQLTAWLCKKFDLTSDNIIRHYDITKKPCPIYFVENEDEWVNFKKEVQKTLDQIK